MANIIKKNLEELGIRINIKKISNSYYKSNLQNLNNYDILLVENIVSIKPDVQNYLNFNVEKQENIEKTFEALYTKYNKNKNFIGLYFNSNILIYTKELKGNFTCNWYNIFYNIDTWCKVN